MAILPPAKSKSLPTSILFILLQSLHQSHWSAPISFLQPLISIQPVLSFHQLGGWPRSTVPPGPSFLSVRRAVHFVKRGGSCKRNDTSDTSKINYYYKIKNKLFHELSMSTEETHEGAPCIKGPRELKIESKEPIVRRYDSPFFPPESIGRDETSPLSALIILNTPIVAPVTPLHNVDDNNVNNVSTSKNVSTSTNNSRNNGDKHLRGVLNTLWERSVYRICADGGANRLHDATVANDFSSDSKSSMASKSLKYIPDVITGDLDSLRPNVRQYYESKGVPILRVEDQNCHDLDKSLMEVERWIEQMEEMKSPNNYENEANCSFRRNSGDVTYSIWIYGGFGGRFDQEMGCINALYVWQNKLSEMQKNISLALYGEETCAFLLPSSFPPPLQPPMQSLPVVNEVRVRFPNGKNYLSNKKVERAEKGTGNNVCVGEGPTCGLIPLGSRCDQITTTGLKWNLDGTVPLAFGGLVSSSNRVMEEVVTIRASAPIVFTAEIIAMKWL